jgi:hypothetical protein
MGNGRFDTPHQSKDDNLEKLISFRLDDTTLKAIEQYCNITDVGKSKGIRDLINMGMLHYIISTLPEE